ncbi:MAG TPA: TldE/PmbA family protein [Planctomycetes bacterium]|nr:TldE/PmbA family protein [Planctomycetota bacterium]
MQKYFYELVDALSAKLRGGEVLLAGFSGEESDFVRFNRSRVRQAGHVSQAHFGLELVAGGHHAKGSLSVSREKSADMEGLAAMLDGLRAQLPHVPEDPYLLYATEVRSGEQHGEDLLPDRGQALAAILGAGAGRDMVGIYAQGGICHGFANSLGQRNWFSTHSFNLDWSFYHAADKAVKSRYAGLEWSDEEFGGRVERAAGQLAVLARPPRTIAPGKYRVYLAPSAMEDFVDMLCWGGFSLKAQRTKTTPLLKMLEGEARLSPKVTIRENTAGGIAPSFQGQGFIRPGQVTLIAAGCIRDCLVSPRSGKEYGLEPNGASGDERPDSLDMDAGDIPAAEALARLGTGIWVNQTWYLNFSDRAACRVTGMTRFATFWVEGGAIAAPLNVMRFDETMYRALGENLVGLTAERDFLLNPGSYGGRSTGSARLPGALIDDFTFTL